MRRITIPMALIAALALATGWMATTLADDSHGGGTVTVRGEVLDMACYVSHEAKGPDHAACAKRCVEGGQPMGLLAEDGTVYLLYASHSDGAAFEQTKAFAGQKVEIQGKKAEQGSLHGLEVNAVKAL